MKELISQKKQNWRSFKSRDSMQKPHQRISRLYEWTPEIGEILKIFLEPENVKDRFAKAVEKEVQIVGHVNK